LENIKIAARVVAHTRDKNMNALKRTVPFRILSSWIIVSFLASAVIPPRAYAQALDLPAPGTMVMTTPAFMPVMMKGIQIHPDNPLLFDFILDTGKSGLKIDGEEFKAESQKLIKYFLASLTIKEDDLWVNLSPYEKDRMITEELGKTELGRDMLAQDYILKQLTASMIYPEKDLGKAFWDRVYTKAQQQFGTTDIPVDTFNKVWIVADKAKVLERNNAAYVVGSHLKVMLEEDYVALGKQTAVTEKNEVADNKAHAVASQVIREVIIPEIEKEVNQGQNFAPLRQMFYSMILASWYKIALKDALLNQVYSNRGKTAGVLSDDPAVKEKIYQQYLKAYKKGVFNYIKEDMDAVSKQPMPRKYFSGGEKMRLRLGENLAISHEQSRDDAPLKDGDLAIATVNVAKSGVGTSISAAMVTRDKLAGAVTNDITAFGLDLKQDIDFIQVWFANDPQATNMISIKAWDRGFPESVEALMALIQRSEDRTGKKAKTVWLNFSSSGQSKAVSAKSQNTVRLPYTISDAAMSGEVYNEEWIKKVPTWKELEEQLVLMSGNVNAPAAGIADDRARYRQEEEMVSYFLNVMPRSPLQGLEPVLSGKIEKLLRASMAFLLVKGMYHSRIMTETLLSQQPVNSSKVAALVEFANQERESLESDPKLIELVHQLPIVKESDLKPNDVVLYDFEGKLRSALFTDQGLNENARRGSPRLVARADQAMVSRDQLAETIKKDVADLGLALKYDIDFIQVWFANDPQATNMISIKAWDRGFPDSIDAVVDMIQQREAQIGKKANTVWLNFSTSGQSKAAAAKSQNAVRLPYAISDAAMNGNELTVTNGNPSSLKDLYRSSLDAMFQEAVVRFVRAGATHEYRWKYQAEFAGELVANPQTFELGRAMLEDAYKQGVALEGRFDADGWPVDQRFDVAHDVIVEMAKHPDLRQQALQLVFDPRTYGMKVDATNEQGFRETREAMGPERQLAAPEIQPEAPIQPEKYSVKRVLGKLFGTPSEVALPVVRPTSQLPKVRVKVSIHDPKILGNMRTLVLAVLKEVGDSDMELAERLIKFRMQLGEWERESTEGKFYEYKAQEVEDLIKYPALLPLLIELANSSRDEEDRGNALMYVVDGYLSAGKVQEAFDLFLKVGRVSYYRFASAIAHLASLSKNRATVLDHFERIISRDRLSDWQIDVADELFRLGAKKEAEYLYNKVWQSLSGSGENRLGLLVALAKGARTTGVKIGKKSAGELLNDANENVTATLNAWDVRRDRSNNILLRAAQRTAFELTLAGRYEEAETLAQLVDKKHRIEYWGGQAGSMRPEERDQMYREMAIASAERGDIPRIEQSLNAMREYKPGALLEIAKIFARKGEYENSIMASVFGADSVDVRGGITTDKGSRGAMSTLVSFIDQGEPVFEVAKIMLAQGMDSQRVGKVLVAATRVGLGDLQLERLVQVIRGHRELTPFLLEIMQNALSKNGSIIAHSQHRVILGALREFFPGEASIAQEEVNTMFEQAGLGKEKAGEQKKDGDDAMAPGGIDLNAKNMGLDVTKDGKGIEMKFDPAMVAEFQSGNFAGVEGIILRIVPIASPLPILGLETSPVEGALAKG